MEDGSVAGDEVVATMLTCTASAQATTYVTPGEQQGSGTVHKSHLKIDTKLFSRGSQARIKLFDFNKDF